MPSLPGFAEPDLAAVATSMRQLSLATGRRAPLYTRLCHVVADDPQLCALLLAAPVRERNPALLFACIHDLLLAVVDDDASGSAGVVGSCAVAETGLLAWYPNLVATPRTDDPGSALRRFCAANADLLRARIGSRVVQTNEIGRCTLLLLAFGLLAEEVGPLAQVDVGTSAGLTLLMTRYAYRYTPGGEVTAATSGTAQTSTRIVLECQARGSVPVPRRMPQVRAAIGVDRFPVDVTDPAQARWLRACVWPDQTERFERLGRALQVAADVGVDVRAGDAVAALPGLVDEAAAAGHPVITTTWVLTYLSEPHRQTFTETLNCLGTTRDLSWVFVESPSATDGLPVDEDLVGSSHSVLGLVTWRSGRRSARTLATCHPHGYRLRWR